MTWHVVLLCMGVLLVSNVRAADCVDEDMKFLLSVQRQVPKERIDAFIEQYATISNTYKSGVQDLVGSGSGAAADVASQAALAGLLVQAFRDVTPLLPSIGFKYTRGESYVSRATAAAVAVQSDLDKLCAELKTILADGVEIDTTIVPAPVKATGAPATTTPTDGGGAPATTTPTNGGEGLLEINHGKQGKLRGGGRGGMRMGPSEEEAFVETQRRRHRHHREHIHRRHHTHPSADSDSDSEESETDHRFSGSDASTQVKAVWTLAAASPADVPDDVITPGDRAQLLRQGTAIVSIEPAAIFAANSIRVTVLPDHVATLARDGPVIGNADCFTWKGSVVVKEEEVWLVLALYNGAVSGFFHSVVRDVTINSYGNLDLAVAALVPKGGHPSAEDPPTERGVAVPALAANAPEAAVSVGIMVGKGVDDELKEANHLSSANADLLLRAKMMLWERLANEAYAQSGVLVTLTLFGPRKSGYTPTGKLKTDLADWKGTTAAFRESVPLGGPFDIVGLVVYEGDICGLADALPAKPNSAFFAVDMGCADREFALTHEIGHLFGLKHEFATAISDGNEHRVWATIMNPSGANTINRFCKPKQKMKWFGEVGECASGLEVNTMNANRAYVAGFRANPAGGGACFPAASTVLLADGVTRVRMDQLRVGHQTASCDPINVGVKSSSTRESDRVYLWLHRHPHARARFVLLDYVHDYDYDYVYVVRDPTHGQHRSSAVTLSGTLAISSDHLLFDASGVARLAGEVRVGDLVLVTPGPSTMASLGSLALVTARVTAIRAEEAEGVYSPATLSGTLVVDGVCVSAYPYRSHALAHAVFAPARMWSRVAQALLGSESGSAAKDVAQTEGYDGYVRFLWHGACVLQALPWLAALELLPADVCAQLRAY